jgi:hypothetical protein
MFSNFCEANRWLVWIYLMDIEADFLLFSNAKGKPPAHVGKEAGFSSSVSALTTPTSTKRKRYMTKYKRLWWKPSKQERNCAMYWIS